VNAASVTDRACCVITAKSGDKFNRYYVTIKKYGKRQYRNIEED
jgi:hypothetical protein